MANSRSDVMANLLATPMVRTSARLGHSRDRSKICTATLDNTEAAGHIIVLARFGYLDIIHQIWASHALIAGATDNNVGLWTSGDWTVADQTVVDADIYVDGYSTNVATADRKWADIAVASGAGQRTSANIGRPIYLDAGHTEAAGALRGTYDVAVQFVVDPAAAGTIKFKIDYSAGD